MQQRAAFRGPGQIVRSASANKTPCLQVRRGAVFSQITSGGTSQPAEDPAHWEAQKTCLWDRQDQLWTRELQRWDDERRQWDKREEAMQQRIKTLENEYFKLVSLLVQARPEAQAPRLQDEALAEIADSPGEAAAMQSLEQGLREDLASGEAAFTTTGTNVPSQAATDPVSIRAVMASTTASEVSSAVPGGPPPVLAAGDCDLYWLNLLHTKMLERGYAAGEEDMEDMMFGDQTQSALVTLQACEGLPETGVADPATWAFLLDDAFESAETSSTTFKEAQSPSDQDVGSSASSFASTQSSADATPVWGSAKSQASKLTKWPMLREGDGGAAVHGLQVALDRMGFNPGKEDMQWWQFGDSTYGALQTMQACSHLPETGVADESTWKVLLGTDAQPGDIGHLLSGNENDLDLTEQTLDQGVWLVGEQRFSKRQA